MTIEEKIDKYLNEEKLDESISAIVGVLLGLLIADALGLYGAGGHYDEPIWKNLKRGRFANSKLLINYVKEKWNDMKIRRQVSKLANDPDISEILSDKMDGRKIKSGKEQDVLNILKSKIDKDNSYKELRDLLDKIYIYKKEK